MAQVPRNVSRGQQLPGIQASTWNAWNEAYILSQRISEQRPQRNKRGNHPANQMLVRVVNDSGQDLDADFPVVRLDEVIVPPNPDDPSDNTPFIGVEMNANIPDAETVGKFAIMSAPVLRGDSGTAIIAGATWATVDITDQAHTHAKAIAGDYTKLTSGADGARILWKPNATGEQYCVVMLANSTDQMGVIVGQCVEDVGPTQDIKIDNMELLWGDMPEGKTEECEGQADCEFTVRNIFKQQYATDDYIVAMQIASITPTEEETPGHSTQSAEDHAAEDAVTGHADDPAEGVDSGGEVEWWGFGVASAASRLFRTTSTIAAANYSSGTSTLQLGSGSAKMFLPTSPGSTALELEADTTTIYNFVETPIASDKNVHASLIHGLWIIDAEDCT